MSKKHWMTDDERADVGLQHRRIRTRDGVPQIPAPRDDITEPVITLERGLNHSEQRVLERSGRNHDDPALVGDIVKLIAALTKEKSENREREKAYAEVLRSPHEIAAEMAKKIRGVKIIIAVAVALVSTGAGVSASGVMAPAPTAPSTERYRIDQVERDILRIDSELREVRMTLGRRGAIDRPSLTLPAATKGLFP